jgi:hypothetical protein
MEKNTWWNGFEKSRDYEYYSINTPKLSRTTGKLRGKPRARKEVPLSFQDDACMGEWFLCKSLETEENCKVFQSEGCAWGKVAWICCDN